MSKSRLELKQSMAYKSVGCPQMIAQDEVLQISTGPTGYLLHRQKQADDSLQDH